MEIPFKDKADGKISRRHVADISRIIFFESNAVSGQKENF